ncbi:hypothetical protein ASZ90_002841 [hydrocarbon metagenome]|uniref:Uncharacterized protein n=1 Tax=hydrocarbon metagenome TaxID=938273 RepID=A0A0W8G2D0_9ZZZZ
MADFSGFQSGGDTAEAAADDEYRAARHRNLPAVVIARMQTA